MFSAQACRVYDMNWHAINLYGLLNGVTRCTRNRGDDGQLDACERIEQRAFACIGLPSNDHAYAFAQQGALLGFLRDPCKVVLHA